MSLADRKRPPRRTPLTVPGDPSSAAVWAAAAAALPGSSVRIEGVCLNPRRLGFIRALERMGARVTVEIEEEVAGEPVGVLHLAHESHVNGVSLSAAEIPDLIDELPVLAARAALGGSLEVSGAGELRVKESDRISALVAGFTALGVRAEERPGRLLRRRLGPAGWRHRGRRGGPSAGHGVCAGRARRVGPDPNHRRRCRRCLVSRLRSRSGAAGAVTTDKIYLVGFMASGKSTIARALAHRLRWQSEDVDDLIERRERRTIADIFTKQGEPYFRAVEREILTLLQPLRQVVVATGGGTFADPDNRAMVNMDGVSVWIDVPLTDLIPRIPLDGRRPLAAVARGPRAALCRARRYLSPRARARRVLARARAGDRRSHPRSHPPAAAALRSFAAVSVSAPCGI